MTDKLHLHNAEDFRTRFYQLVREHYPEKTYVEIYFMVENEHIKTCKICKGATRYASYDSFRKILARHIGQQKENA